MYRSDIYRIVKKQKYNFHVRKKVQIKKLRRICNHRSFFICTLHYLFSIKFPLTLPTAKAGGSVNLCHNHPSGDTNPSQEDIQITESIGKAGSLIGVSLLDHLIIGEKNYTSLREIQAVTFE